MQKCYGFILKNLYLPQRRYFFANSKAFRQKKISLKILVIRNKFNNFTLKQE